MKKLFFSLLVITTLAIFNPVSAQWRLNAGIDLLRTPFFEPFPSVNIGAEVAYFITGSVAFTGGFEYWDKSDLFGGAAGVRWYPVNPVFLRMRGILASDPDLGLGIGYAIPLNSKWRIELMSDYYAVEAIFAIRFGMGVKF